MRKNRRQRQTNEVRRSQRLLQKHVSPPSSTIYPASSIITAHQRYDNNSCTPCTAIYTPTGIPEAGVGVGVGWARGGLAGPADRGQTAELGLSRLIQSEK